MGDVIHTLPAVQALREALPEATIGWLIEERWAELLCAAGVQRHGPRSAQRPLVDWVHAVRIRNWGRSLLSVATAEQIARTWNDVRAAKYGVAIDLQGAIRSALLARCSGARIVVGAAEARESPASLFYTRSIVAHGTHVIEQHLSMVEVMAGKSLSVPRAPLPCDPTEDERTQADLKLHGVGDYAIINPGAGWGAKRWPAQRYGEVARALSNDGLRTLVNIGPGEDDLFQQVNGASGGGVRPTKPTISGLIALMRRAKLFIGGDTGPLHLAAALQIPVVGIFGPTDPARNGPYGTRSVVLRNPESVTSHARLAHPEEGMLGIGVDDVVAAARRLLAGAKSADGGTRGTQTRPADAGGAHG